VIDSAVISSVSVNLEISDPYEKSTIITLGKFSLLTPKYSPNLYPISLVT